MSDAIDSLNNLRRCTRCALPETHESITFDADGVCNVCRQVEYKQQSIDWAARQQELDALIEHLPRQARLRLHRPVLGRQGLDVHALVPRQGEGLKPLVVSFDHGFYRPTTSRTSSARSRRSASTTCRFRPNWAVVQRLMLEALERKGDFCWHCHTGIFCYPMQIAVKFKVPLVFWGEPSAEYTSYYGYDSGVEEVDERRFNRFVNLGITAEDMVGMLGSDIDMRDLEPFAYPKLKEMRRVGVRSVCLGSFIPWDVKQHVEIIKRELDWREDVVEGVPSQYGYEKIECSMQGVRDYIKYLKRGYGRTAHLISHRHPQRAHLARGRRAAHQRARRQAPRVARRLPGVRRDRRGSLHGDRLQAHGVAVEPARPRATAAWRAAVGHGPVGSHAGVRELPALRARRGRSACYQRRNAAGELVRGGGAYGLERRRARRHRHRPLATRS